MRIRKAWLAAALVTVPLAAKAQPFQGLYVGGGAGYNLLQAFKVTPSVPGIGSVPVRLDKSNGLAAVGSLGYGFGNGWRVEVEGDFLRNGISAPNITTLPTTIRGFPVPATTLGRLIPGDLSGHVLSYGALANGLYDFDISSRYVFPYLGLGAGYIWNDLTHSGKFAWQAIAGLSFPIPHVPGLSLTAQYRFLDVTAGERYNTTIATPLGGVPVRVKVGQQLNHSILLGVRYTFGVQPPPGSPAPEAAPVAAPSPAPARSYLVFFDWDRATLTGRARDVVREAAAASTRVQYTQIRVSGYTDTSGSGRYNMGLSLRRAQSVAAELVRDGVAASAIRIRGFGETHLLVPTGPGVREPQNRRVDIVIR
ncbi:MAG: OmpA family protein [Pseudomonadota bacterium]|nr:OmpA family protein [Pseudomonadota bacterium]